MRFKEVRLPDHSGSLTSLCVGLSACGAGVYPPYRGVYTKTHKPIWVAD